MVIEHPYSLQPACNSAAHLSVAASVLVKLFDNIWVRKRRWFSLCPQQKPLPDSVELVGVKIFVGLNNTFATDLPVYLELGVHWSISFCEHVIEERYSKSKAKLIFQRVSLLLLQHVKNRQRE